MNYFVKYRKNTKLLPTRNSNAVSCSLRACGLIFILTAAPIAGSGTSAIAQSNFDGDVSAGEKIFKKCKACHKVGPNAKNSTGPVLNNIVDRPAGSYEGYKYGKGMKAANAKGLVWTEENIFGYIKNPKKFLRTYLGNKKAKAKMRFKLKGETDRKNVIAFLSSISTASKDDEMEEMSKPSGDNSPIGATSAMVHKAGAGEICVQNQFDKSLLFTAEAKGGKRELKTMKQGEVLCVPTAEGNNEGTVGVFENEDALEGCSRLAKAGHTEILIAYASFDNCSWKQ